MYCVFKRRFATKRVQAFDDACWGSKKRDLLGTSLTLMARQQQQKHNKNDVVWVGAASAGLQNGTCSN